MMYKGVYIERNYRGYYVAWLSNSCRYCQADTLTACRQMIEDDLKRNITCKER